MFGTNFPEAFSEEFQEFEQACAEDAHTVQIWMDFGFDENEAFRFAMEEPVKKVTPTEELLNFFGA